MRNLILEKSIKKLDREIEALKIVTKYLSNIDEINSVKEELNQKRQLLANEIYAEDSKSYVECCDAMLELLNKELGKDEQIKLLETIKEIYGRQYPNVSKVSNGLNAWLKELDVQCKWIENPDSEWATLVITSM